MIAKTLTPFSGAKPFVIMENPVLRGRKADGSRNAHGLTVTHLRKKTRRKP